MAKKLFVGNIEWGVTDEDLQKSESEGWWGDEIPYVPAE